jgi:antitoxin CptB
MFTCNSAFSILKCVLFDNYLFMNDISLLRKKLIYRSLHRGCKETDILLEKFALKYINQLSSQELLEYEKIVALNDYDLYCYITNKKEVPRGFSQSLFKVLKDCNAIDCL